MKLCLGHGLEAKRQAGSDENDGRTVDPRSPLAHYPVDPVKSWFETWFGGWFGGP